MEGDVDVGEHSSCDCDEKLLRNIDAAACARATEIP
jgi:hypothetical protein